MASSEVGGPRKILLVDDEEAEATLLVGRLGYSEENELPTPEEVSGPSSPVRRVRVPLPARQGIELTVDWISSGNQSPEAIIEYLLTQGAQYDVILYDLAWEDDDAIATEAFNTAANVSVNIGALKEGRAGRATFVLKTLDDNGSDGRSVLSRIVLYSMYIGGPKGAFLDKSRVMLDLPKNTLGWVMMMLRPYLAGVLRKDVNVDAGGLWDGLVQASEAIHRELGLNEAENLTQVGTEVVQLRKPLRIRSDLVGKSPAIETIRRQIALVAPRNSIVLILGENGSGKEVVAQAIHEKSPRANNDFVCLNCAALAESLLASELFGHEKGAFTDASARRIGKFEAAHNGTLMLDEIGEMPLSIQAKFLRVLEGHPFERVGGTQPLKVDVRVIAATNRNLEEEVASGRFRRDLYFRLRVMEIVVPGLGKHKEDIPELAEYFLRKFNAETGRCITGFTSAAMNKLLNYSWPGNVRELKNMIERAVVLCQTGVIDENDLLLSNLTAGADNRHSDPDPLEEEDTHRSEDGYRPPKPSHEIGKKEAKDIVLAIAKLYFEPKDRIKEAAKWFREWVTSATDLYPETRQKWLNHAATLSDTDLVDKIRSGAFRPGSGKRPKKNG